MKEYRLSFGDQVNAALKNVFPYAVLEMKEPVDAAKLTAAINEALVLHPTFKVRLIKRKGLYYFQENDREARAVETDWKTDIVYGNEEYGYFPWIILCGGKRIVFTCPHLMTDGMGCASFLGSILNIYLDGPKEPVNKQILARREEDSFAANHKEGLEPPYKIKDFGKPFKISKSLFLKQPTREMDRFILKRSDVKRVVKETETTTFSVLASIFATSLARAMQKDEGSINVLVPCNMRPFYKSISDRGFVYTAQLHYDIARQKDKPIYYSATAFRSQLDLLVDKDYLDYSLSQDKKQTELLLKHPFIIMNLAKLALYNMLYAPKASIVYTHIVDAGLPKHIEEHLEDLYIGGAERPTPLLVMLASTFKDEISILPAEYLKDDRFVDAMKEVLEELGIEYRTEPLFHFACYDYEKKRKR